MATPTDSAADWRVIISRLGKTLILTATYNERDNVPDMYERLRSLELDADMLFVDDSSPDGTGELLDEMKKKDARLFVLHRPGKQGVGSAHSDGIEWAYDNGYETLLSLDCDFTHSPENLPRLIDASDDRDVVVGSRFLEPDSLREWPWIRRFLTHTGHFMTRRLLGLPTDATGSLRLYKLTNIPRKLFSLVESRGYAFFFESLFLLHDNGLKVGDVPIVLWARRSGHSKMSVREVLRSTRRVFELAWIRFARPQSRRIARREIEPHPSLPAEAEWDSYWEGDRGLGLYDVIAAIYRSMIMRPQLNRAIRREFAPQSRLIHAGCGSGQVDEDLHASYSITAVDVSRSALDVYQRNNPRVDALRHASVFALPYDFGSFDGVYNLGVVEHFPEDEIVSMLKEFERVLSPGGKVVLFWPHRRGTSVFVIRIIHWIMHNLFRSTKLLRPPEVCHLRSPDHARDILERAGLTLSRYTFGPSDGWVQAVVVGSKK